MNEYKDTVFPAHYMNAYREPEVQLNSLWTSAVNGRGSLHL